jgi:hypothetical protein
MCPHAQGAGKGGEGGDRRLLQALGTPPSPPFSGTSRNGRHENALSIDTISTGIFLDIDVCIH